MRLLLIGRSAHADVVVTDPSVGATHAEVVITADGRIHVTDRATAGGTYHRVAPDAPWSPLRQAFVDASDELRLGDYVCRVDSLLAEALEPTAGDEDHGWTGEATHGGPQQHDGGGRSRPRGAVERDPVTGEIVRRRL